MIAIREQVAMVMFGLPLDCCIGCHEDMDEGRDEGEHVQIGSDVVAAECCCIAAIALRCLMGPNDPQLQRVVGW